MTPNRLAALTLREPWASAICRWPAIEQPGKLVENRDWKPPARRGSDRLGLDEGDWLVIHAGKTVEEAAIGAIFERFGVRLDPQPGHILGVVRYVGIRTPGGCADDDPWFCGPVGWVFSEARPVPAIAFTGRRKLYQLSDVLTQIIRAHARLDSPSDHRCHARGCSVRCRPEHLMCREHWRRVPEPLKREVWKHYRPGQCDDKRPSKEWHAAADAAIRAVTAGDRQRSFGEVIS